MEKQIMDDKNYPPWLFTLMVDMGSYREQVTEYVSPLEHNNPRHWQMKSLIRKLKKHKMRKSRQLKQFKSADEMVAKRVK